MSGEQDPQKTDVGNIAAPLAANTTVDSVKKWCLHRLPIKFKLQLQKNNQLKRFPLYRHP